MLECLLLFLMSMSLGGGVGNDTLPRQICQPNFKTMSRLQVFVLPLGFPKILRTLYWSWRLVKRIWMTKRYVRNASLQDYECGSYVPTVTPGIYGKMVGNPKYDWGFTTVSFIITLLNMGLWSTVRRLGSQIAVTEKCYGQGSLIFVVVIRQPSNAYNRGKGLGGSSALNFFLWSKPSKFDIDGMPNEVDSLAIRLIEHLAFEKLGNHDWNWETFDKYSKKAEG